MNQQKLIWILAMWFMACLPATAYRFPDAVEQKIVLTGKSAISIAELFGLTSAQRPAVSLKLSRGDAWAIYLLKQDTKVPLDNDNEGSPTRYDTIEFSTTPSASLTISPFWLDLGTQGPSPKPDYYSFSSPFLPESLNENDPWTQLVRRLKQEPGWNKAQSVQFRRCYAFPDGRELCIEVYGDQDYAGNPKKIGYAVVITVHAEGLPPGHKRN
jgi:hypothetical protein